MSHLVSIIIPTKDRCELLRETLQSVMDQTYDEWEAIVIDDDSSDETAQMVTALAAGEPRIRFLQRAGELGGAPVCRNQGVAAAAGEYIIFLDSDDLLAPTCLENRVATMRQHPELDFGVFRTQLFQNEPGDRAVYWNRDTGECDIDRFLRLDVPWQTTGPIWRHTALDRVGDWDESLLSAQDWDYHLRALVEGLRHARFPLRDCYWRVMTSKRPSIGSAADEPHHLETRRQLLVKTHELLREPGMLNPLRCRLLAAQFFHFARQWEPDAGLGGALELWKTCRDLELIGRRVYWEGYVFLRMRWARIRMIILKHYLERRWPDNMFRSPTLLQNTPGELIDCDQCEPTCSRAIEA